MSGEVQGTPELARAIQDLVRLAGLGALPGMAAVIAERRRMIEDDDEPRYSPGIGALELSPADAKVLQRELANSAALAAMQIERLGHERGPG